MSGLPEKSALELSKVKYGGVLLRSIAIGTIHPLLGANPLFEKGWTDSTFPLPCAQEKASLQHPGELKSKISWIFRFPR
jgi:hypothetical protein